MVLDKSGNYQLVTQTGSYGLAKNKMHNNYSICYQAWDGCYVAIEILAYDLAESLKLWDIWIEKNIPKPYHYA